MSADIEEVETIDIADVGRLEGYGIISGNILTSVQHIKRGLVQRVWIRV